MGEERGCLFPEHAFSKGQTNSVVLCPTEQGRRVSLDPALVKQMQCGATNGDLCPMCPGENGSGSGTLAHIFYDQTSPQSQTLSLTTQ